MTKIIVAPFALLLDADLKPAEFKVIVALYSFRDKNIDTVWPKLETLAKRAGYKDIREVSKITARLEKKGWLTKSRPRFHGPINYKLTVPDRLDEVCEDAQVGQSAQHVEVAQVGQNAQHAKPPQKEPRTNAQVGQNAQHVEVAQVGEITLHGENPQHQVGQNPQHQVGQNAQHDLEHTNEHTIEHKNPISSWWPNSETLEVLWEFDKIPSAFIDGELPEFKIYWKDRQDNGEKRDSWNSKFLQHIRRRWRLTKHTWLEDPDNVFLANEEAKERKRK